MTFGTEIPLWGIILVSLQVIHAIVTFFMTRRKDIDQRFDNIGERFEQGSRRMEEHARRLDALDQTVGDMPGRQDLHKLELMLAGMAGDMKGMMATMGSMADSLKRAQATTEIHEQWMREQQ